MAGLIDNLANKRALHSAHGVTPATHLSVEDLTAMLRSDETRGALRRALYEDREPWVDYIDAVVRVLTGEAICTRDGCAAVLVGGQRPEWCECGEAADD